MEKLVTYPEVNPIQMVRVNYPGLLTTTKYKFPHYNEWWQCERRAAHEPPVYYHQKIQQQQRFPLVFHSNNNGELGAVMTIYNSDWTQAAQVFAANVTVSGFEITSEVSNTAYTAYTHIVDINFATLGLADGFYYMVMEVPYATGDPVYYISEPLFLREQHPNTKLLEYSNTINNFDVFFVDHTINYQLRVESHLFNLTPNSIDTSYEDELVDVTLLDSVPYNTYTLAFRGIPEWMVNKINRAFSCDLIRWEGKYYTKDKDAKFDMQGRADSPVKGMSITVRPAKNRYSQQNIVNDPVLIYTILNNGDSGQLTRFPYFVHTATLNRTGALPIDILQDLNGVNTIGAYSTDCLEVRNTSDEQILLDYANNDRKPFWGQMGYYGFVTNSGGDLSMYYYPHASEQNYIASTKRVLSKNMIIRFSSNWNLGQYYDVRGSYIGYGLVRQNNTHANAKYGNGNMAITHLVGGSSINIINNVARLYHYEQHTSSETVDLFHATYPFETPNIQEVDGTYPAALIGFRLTSGTDATFVNWAVFTPCKAVIFGVSYYKNAINLVQGMDSSFGGQQLTNLHGYDLSFNSMADTMVDSVFNQMYNGGAGNETFTVVGGEMYTDFQNPTAPPTGASAAAVNFIDNTKGWLVGTD